MGAHNEDSQLSPADLFAAAVGVRPLSTVAARQGLSAARWRLPGFRALREDYPHGILAYRSAGSACVTRCTRGTLVRRRPKIGSVTFLPGDTLATWTLDGPSETLHVYVPRGLIERYAAEHLRGAVPPRINGFFAIVDPWLDGYFRMLASELDACDRACGSLDPLLLEDTERLLLRHLIRAHSDAAAQDLRTLELQAKVNPLRPALMRRVEEYVHANLGSELSLPVLAGTCCMSVDHFLRSFRTAAGITPYQYVLQERLQRAASMLRTTPAPIVAVAASCGFSNPSHFSVKFRTHFGVSPNQYRRDAGAP